MKFTGMIYSPAFCIISRFNVEADSEVLGIDSAKKFFVKKHGEDPEMKIEMKQEPT